MPSLSHAASVAAGVPLILLALGGCFLLPPGPIATGLASPSPSVETATPLPAEQKALPGRLPLTCEELLPASAVAAVLEIPESLFALVEEPLTFFEAAQSQGGHQSCVWAEVGAPLHDSRNLSVSILSDGAVAFDTYQSKHLPEPGSVPGLVLGAIGENSDFYCDVATLRSCIGAFESDGYWIHFSLTGSIATGESPSDADPAVSIGLEIRDAIHAAGEPVVMYSMPADSARAWSDCAEINRNGSFLREVGSPSLLLRQLYRTDPGDNHISQVAFDHSDAKYCSWAESDPQVTNPDELYYLEASILPGGGWAWPEVKSSALGEPESATQTVPGADDAVLWCVTRDIGTDCWVVALAEHGILWVAAHKSPESSEDVAAATVAAVRYLIKRL